MAKVNTIVMRVDAVACDTSHEDVYDAARTIEDRINYRIKELEAMDGVDVTSVQVIPRYSDQQIGFITYRQLVKADV